MADTFYIVFTKHKMMDILAAWQILNPLASYNFSVTRTKTGKYSIRRTVRPYAYLIKEEDVSIAKAVDWGGIPPTSMMRVEGTELRTVANMISKDGIPDKDFIEDRLVDF